MNIHDIAKQIRHFADQIESQDMPSLKPDPYAELKAAHAAGKVIQYRSLNCPVWQDQSSISWNPPDAPYKPEYRIKPEEPAFQLPPPPPGMRWHRTDGWKEGDLPQGMRPLLLEEHSTNATQQRYSVGWMRLSNSVIAYPLEEPMRTTRPLTFQHAGKTWTYHRPGNPRPCDGDSSIHILTSEGCVHIYQRIAEQSQWERIIGWRYADEKKTVPFGPEDVLPGSVFRWPEWPKFHWKAIRELDLENVYFCAGIGDTHGSTMASYELLKSDKAEINRSIPLTGKWNPDAWETCSKEVLA